MGKIETSRTISSVETAIHVAEVLQELDGARVGEVAQALDLAPSTVHAHLKTLEKHELVIQHSDRYYLGLRFLSIGGYVAAQRQEYELARQKVKKLADETGERVQYIAEEHGRGVYIHTETGNQAVQIEARVGRRNYLHASAAGKAILAQYSEERIREIVDRWGLVELTDQTITSIDELFDELDEVRDQRYAVNNEESTPGLYAVGVPVLGKNDRVAGALSVSGPSNRMKGSQLQSDLPNLILGVANELELNLQYS